MGAVDESDGGRFIVIKEVHPTKPGEIVTMKALVESGRAFPSAYYGYGQEELKPESVQDWRTAWMTTR
jgi:hypothetical protein